MPSIGNIVKPLAVLAAACLVVGVGIGGRLKAQSAPPQGDPAIGLQTFLAWCAPCHESAAGRPNVLGPNLFGVVGRETGVDRTFVYSNELIGADLFWTDETLDEWLVNPQKLVPGTRMDFPGLEAKDRADVIAFLKKNR